jgi:hypothetical protein
MRCSGEIGRGAHSLCPFGIGIARYIPGVRFHPYSSRKPPCYGTKTGVLK